MSENTGTAIRLTSYKLTQHRPASVTALSQEALSRQVVWLKGFVKPSLRQVVWLKGFFKKSLG